MMMVVLPVRTAGARTRTRAVRPRTTGQDHRPADHRHPGRRGQGQSDGHRRAGRQRNQDLSVP